MAMKKDRVRDRDKQIDNNESFQKYFQILKQ